MPTPYSVLLGECAAAFPSLSYLNLTATDGSPKTLAAFTALYPRLETLVLRYAIWIASDGMPLAPAPLRLRRLELYSGGFEAAAFIWLCQRSVLDHLVLFLPPSPSSTK